jgi:hypothetical protein
MIDSIDKNQIVWPNKTLSLTEQEFKQCYALIHDQAIEFDSFQTIHDLIEHEAVKLRQTLLSHGEC